VVLADAGRGDWVLCQITSNPYGDPAAVPIADTDFAAGSLHRASFARPGKLFTANAALVVAQVGQLQAVKQRQIVAAVVALLEGRAQ
jgi:mRNA interferase MazF